MKIKNTRTSGFTLVEIMIVVAIIGLVAAIAVPNFVKARSLSRKNTCLANLRQIENAKLVWANEEKKSGPSVPSEQDLFGSTKYLRYKPECPGGGAYTMTAVDESTKCSLSLEEGHKL